MKKTTYRVTFVQDDDQLTVDERFLHMALFQFSYKKIDIATEDIHIPNREYPDEMDGVYGCAVLDVCDALDRDTDDLKIPKFYDCCVEALKRAYLKSPTIGIDYDNLKDYYEAVEDAYDR
jgi:hypothetical protein